MYSATPDGLRAAANDCMMTNENIRGRITTMRNYMVALSGVYKGRASLELQRVASEWEVLSNQLNFVLSTISNGLNQNAANYELAEMEGTANLSRAGSGMPPARF
jgi:WXG100 family type VII secretion target